MLLMFCPDYMINLASLVKFQNYHSQWMFFTLMSYFLIGVDLNLQSIHFTEMENSTFQLKYLDYLVYYFQLKTTVGFDWIILTYRWNSTGLMTTSLVYSQFVFCFYQLQVALAKHNYLNQFQNWMALTRSR